MFRRHGGILRTSRAIALGVHPRTLYALRDAGRLVRLSRGLYRLTGRGPLGEPDLVTVALRVPRAVVCLISALHFHRVTTEIPHAVDVALPRGTKPPRLDYPPIRIHQFAREAPAAGVETHLLDGVAVRVFGPEKTVGSSGGRRRPPVVPPPALALPRASPAVRKLLASSGSLEAGARLDRLLTVGGCSPRTRPWMERPPRGERVRTPAEGWGEPGFSG